MTRAARTAAVGGKKKRVYLVLGASNGTLDRAGSWTAPSNLYEWNWTTIGRSVTATGTVTIASPGVWTVSSHGAVAGDRVLFTTTGALPTGLSTNTAYYVISSGLTTNAFQVSATAGGAAINTSGSQSGTHTARFIRSSGSADEYVLQYVPGTAFARFDGTQKNMAVHAVYKMALTEPEVDHYIIRLCRGGLFLAQFIDGATPYPTDYAMWDIIENNVPAALTAIGATQVDYLIWAGVADASTVGVSDLPDRFDDILDQFYLTSWFPRTTPIVMVSLTSGTISNNITYWNDNNDACQEIVRRDPSNRIYVHLPDIPLLKRTKNSGTFTVTIASPGVVSWTAHGLSVGDVVYMRTTGALPTGLEVGTPHYVISAGFGTNAFQLSTTSGGSAINTSGSQSGTHTAYGGTEPYWQDAGYHNTFNGMALAGDMIFKAMRYGWARPLVARQPWQNIATTITWNGTPPSGSATTVYTWERIGNLVIARFRLEYATAGTGNTTLSIIKPADMPNPAAATGYGTGEIGAPGYGVVATLPTGGSAVYRAWITDASGVYEFDLIFASANYRFAAATFIYTAAE